MTTIRLLIDSQRLGGVGFLGATLLLTATTACQPLSLDKTKLSKVEHGLRLEAEAQPGAGDTLEFTYRLANENETDAAFVFNRLWVEFRGDAYDTDVNRAYVFPIDDGIVVSKSIPTVPENTTLEQEMVPCATRVEPGKEMVETFRLPIPLSTYSAYPAPDTSFLLKQPLYFEVGVVALSPDAANQMARHASTTEGPAHWLDTSPNGQRTIRLGPFGEVAVE